MAGRKINLSDEQAAAVAPTMNIVVQANAGTGKTFVLVQRLLRLIFREFVANEQGGAGILCLTYTNAGAAEMRNRILAAVSEWARADDGELRDLLVGIAHNNPPTDADLGAARKIFYDFIDNPGRMKIQTIHSFCEDILRRFPVEADAPPSWRLVSGAEQRRLLKDAFAELMNKTPTPRIMEAFDNILGATSEYSLDALLDSLVSQYTRIIQLKNDFKSVDYIIEKTGEYLDLGQKSARPVFDEKIYGKYLKKDGGLNKTYKNPPAEAVQISEQLRAAIEYENNAEIMRISADFLVLCDAFATRYSELKNRRGLLDFDDILHKTAAMFRNQKTMGQVLSQLDFGIKHILVDESQDNAPVMWDIIFSMLGDFFSVGEKQNPRTMFAVGDIKQSIFSFQGASPSDFAAAPEKIGRAAGAEMRQYATVPLLESRRASRAVLEVVDFFFNALKPAGLPENIEHRTWRKNDFGQVQIAPLLQKNGEEELEITRKNYAKMVAERIENLISSGAAAPSDIMILVQRRRPFADLISAELKRKNIPTAGSDRIILPDFPAVRDLLHLLRFAALPNAPGADAELAFVLRGPIFRWTENALAELCIGRDKTKTLFATMGARAADDPEKYGADFAKLNEIAARGADAPFDFFSYIMNRWRGQFIRAFGRQCIEPLNEFMTIALSYSRTRAGGLPGFLRWFLDGENEIRRDMERGAGVRILTAHSSKGLEAPIVFLVDTTKNPRSPAPVGKFSPLAPAPDVMLCKTGEIESEKYDAAKEIDIAKKTEEYWRLLYVAMTRARDRLFVFGCAERTANENWHGKLYEIIKNMPGAVVADDGTITIESGEVPPAAAPEKSAKNIEKLTLTEYDNVLKRLHFLTNHLKDDLSAPRRRGQGSKPYLDKKVLSPIPACAGMTKVPSELLYKNAMEYGIEIHKQLETINLADNNELADKIKSNPAIARFWSADSRAEIPIAGDIGGRFHSYRIDRMIVSENAVEILDYKTDATRDRRDSYAAKLGDYAALLTRIYPGRRVAASILWLHNWKIEEVKL
ncbi:MAG: UvrD-helicase domain-containing protein [Rickettsiales bacterium]|nr:UvrD-helicase domain-containing protein [Rickettsiales bacterium]